MTGKIATETLQATDSAISRAAGVLRDGGLVVVPTETVYGLAARADSAEAVAGIYRAKGRPSFNPLIVHIPNLAQAKLLAHFDDIAERVAEATWPGALTLVLPQRNEAQVAPAVTAGLGTIALRCPSHPIMQALLSETALPLAAPSANRSNAISPTSVQHVLATLDGRIDLVLDDGASEQGLESTILAIRHDGTWEQLRPGPVDIAALHCKITRRNWQPPTVSEKVEAPGQLARHYSPGKPMRLDAHESSNEEYHIGFGPIDGDFNLSRPGDTAEAAAKLYAALHLAAASHKPRIAVAPIPVTGMGVAIADRLKRAAA